MADSCCTPGRGGASDRTHHHAAEDKTPGAGSEAHRRGAPNPPGVTDAAGGPRRAANQTVRFEKDMVALGGGTFVMGTEDGRGFPADGEGPEREITLSPFSIDKYTVTNRQFAAFVEETGYKTEAERFGWSYVFHLFVSKTALKRGQVREVPGLGWWLGVLGADWKHPYGKGTSYRGVLGHPVVHVSWNDAAAFAKWAGKRLPTEAEWEYAARGGLEHAVYPWGDELTPGGKHNCNIWQGDFPRSNTKADGYASTCPVDSYEANGFGLYNVSGNVWEWCADYWSPDFHLRDVRTNPKGPPTGNARVTRGGSYLCHHSYCNRYRVAARTSNTPDSSTGNTGFRCAL